MDIHQRFNSAGKFFGRNQRVTTLSPAAKYSIGSRSRVLPSVGRLHPNPKEIVQNFDCRFFIVNTIANNIVKN